MKQGKKSPFGNFADRVGERMLELGLNGQEVAAKTGVTPTAVSRYRQGRVPGTEEAFRLARTLKLPVTWLITGEGPRDGSEGYRWLLSAFARIAKEHHPDSISEQEALLDRLTEAVAPLLNMLLDERDNAADNELLQRQRASDAERRLNLLCAALDAALKQWR